MALVDCPDCGRKVSERAPTCPGCGAPLSAASGSVLPRPDAATVPTSRSVITPPMGSPAMTAPPLPASPVTAPPALVIRPQGICPNCHSDSFQNVRVLYEAGTTQITGGATTVGATWNRTARATVGGALTSIAGVQQSALAQRHAPPQPTTGNRGGLIGISIYIAFSGFFLLFAVTGGNLDPIFTIGSLIGFPIGIWLFVRTLREHRQLLRYNTEVLPGLIEDWAKTWVCLRCGFYGNA